MDTSIRASLTNARSMEAARAMAARGTAGCRDLSQVMDAAIRSLAAPLPERTALIAVGGYGREELFRHSGLDILVLTESAVAPPAFPESLRAAGIPVHVSARTVDQLQHEENEIETLLNYLDAHLIAGDEQVFHHFLAARRRLLQRARAALRRELVRRHRARNEVERWQLQEPNLLRSRGGLNALHALRATARLGEIIGEHADSSAVASKELIEDGELLVRVRAALHAISDEHADRWRLDLTPVIAGLLAEEPAGLTRQLLLAMRRIDEAAARSFDVTTESRLVRWARKLLPPPPVSHDPTRITDRQRVDLTLQAVEPRALDPMPREEWLDRLLPEWDILRGKPHAAVLHQHPVDTHTVRTIAEMRRSLLVDADGMGTPLVAQELASDDEALVAALLHDIGQVALDDIGAGPAIAARFASRLGFDSDASQRLAKITALNQLLTTTALRRDISEPHVIAEVAGQVGDLRTLHLLYLVSIADARATGPGTWDLWKAALMRTLYVRVLAHLGADDPASGASPLARREAVIAALAERFDRDQVTHHLDALTPGYLLAIRPDTIGNHLALIDEAAGATATRHDRLPGMERLTVVTSDRPGVLSMVAGAIAANSINVLGCNAYTRSDGIAIEVLHVRDALGGDINEDRWTHLQRDIGLAVVEQLDIKAGIRAARDANEVIARAPSHEVVVRVENPNADPYSVIEVMASDRTGLLYAITSALHEQHINILLAKVDTFGTEVVDAFHVLRENGRRIEATDEVERLRQRIKAAVSALDN